MQLYTSLCLGFADLHLHLHRDGVRLQWRDIRLPRQQREDDGKGKIIS